MDQLNPAHVRGRDKAGKIADDPASQGDQRAIAVEAEPCQPRIHVRGGGETLAGLAGRHDDREPLVPPGPERGQQLCPGAPQQGAVPNHPDPPPPPSPPETAAGPQGPRGFPPPLLPGPKPRSTT